MLRESSSSITSCGVLTFLPRSSWGAGDTRGEGGTAAGCPSHGLVASPVPPSRTYHLRGLVS